jgi:hypothetical protein
MSKELTEINFGGAQAEGMIGQHVVVRDIACGVFFGTLDSLQGKSWTLSNARQIWQWEKRAATPGVAARGLGPNSKVGPEVQFVTGNDLAICLMASDEAWTDLTSQPEWRP